MIRYFLDRFKKSAELKTSPRDAYAVIPLWGDTSSYSSPLSQAARVTMGYQKNVVVYRCVSLIARTLASIPIGLYDAGSQEVLQHPFMQLLEKPNPLQDRRGFIENLISHLLLFGNVYVEAIKCDDNLEELYLLRPDRVKIRPDERGFPDTYMYTVGTQTRRIEVDINSDHFQPLHHLKLFHPQNDLYGMSPLEAAQGSVELHNTMSSHNVALLKNGGRPSGAFVVKRPMVEAQRGQLRQDLQDMYEGASNAGKVVVLEGDFEWKEMGLSLKDLDFLKGKHLSTREIAQAFGVPPVLVGIEGDSTYNNYREARCHFWEDTLLPLCDYVLQSIARWILPCFEPGLNLRCHVDKIPALSERREVLWEKLEACSFLTVDEKRQAIGYPPLKETNKD